jgi:hypothetical protein
VAAAGEHEWRPLAAQRGGDGPDILALQIDVEDGEIESPVLDFLQRRFDAVAIAADLVAQRQHEILEHHRD